MTTGQIIDLCILGLLIINFFINIYLVYDSSKEQRGGCKMKDIMIILGVVSCIISFGIIGVYMVILGIIHRDYLMILFGVILTIVCATGGMRILYPKRQRMK